MKPLDCISPLFLEDEIVPIGDQVPERAAVVTERDATVHAATRLYLQLFWGKRFVNFSPVGDAHWYRAPLGQLAVMMQKASDIAHPVPP